MPYAILSKNPDGAIVALGDDDGHPFAFDSFNEAHSHILENNIHIGAPGEVMIGNTEDRSLIAFDPKFKPS